MNKLASFLYLLMRDELALGKVAGIVKEVIEIYEKYDADEIAFTNTHLADYAKELAERLSDNVNNRESR